jgi:putative endonuclease
MYKNYFVYIISNTSKTLYVGMTVSLAARIEQHKQHKGPAFTSQYHIWKLVYFEIFDNPKAAVDREKQIKNWRREKKIRLIRLVNPRFDELSAL